jgi:hypothetical protein
MLAATQDVAEEANNNGGYVNALLLWWTSFTVGS